MLGSISRRLSLFALALSPVASFAETPGKDGDVTVSGSGIVVNQYAAVSGTTSAGASSITGVNLAAAMPGLAAGDLVMIYQAQGATIDASDTTAYGSVTSYNSAGRYEFQTVASVSGNTISFASYAGTCTGLRYGYTSGGGAQIVRVPQYRNLTVNAGASIAAQPWNGTTGGVIAATTALTATINGTVTASGAGFRGGAVDDANSGYAAILYRTSDPAMAAEKGESIAGYQASLPGGLFYGRGAPANGGGGGNAHNGGGGGGANGNNGNVWAGQGRPDTSNASWNGAWNLDPSLNTTTSNSGGGRGGYTYANGPNPGNAGIIPPGDSRWEGDNRREAGGLGGRPLAFSRTDRVFFGGGGGAGDGNNAAAGAGGRGGGLVFLQATTLSGSGLIVASGSAGGNTTQGHNDAPGGGGGGGTILAQAGTVGSVNFTASGGIGGNQLITSFENEGPGGGGGGGVIAITGGVSKTANGGANGTTTSTNLTDFPPNGATRGAIGQPTATGPSRAEVPICYAPSPTVSKTSATYETVGINRFNIPAADVIYTITLTNPGTQIDTGALAIVDTLPPQLTFYNGDIDDAGPLTGNYQFVDGSPTSSLACCTVAYSSLTSGTDFSYVPAAGYDASVRRIRYTPTGAMAPGSTTATSFQIRLRGRIN